MTIWNAIDADSKENWGLLIDVAGTMSIGNTSPVYWGPIPDMDPFSNQEIEDFCSTYLTTVEKFIGPRFETSTD